MSLPNLVLFFCSLFILSNADQVPAAPDLASLLQQPVVVTPPEEVPKAHEAESEKPFIIGLRRESVPVYRRGKVASFKTSYSGVLNVGTPAQEFRVVFDTGSGNIVLPAAECKTEACLVPDRRRFNMSASSTAVAINQDGSRVPEGEACDQVTIGFGTGEISGEFTRDTVCFGSPRAEPVAGADAVGLVEVESKALAAPGSEQLCVEMSVILAVEMSTQPFKTFRFDGILGLGLKGLAMNNQFSAFEMILGTGLPNAYFGVFLSEGEDGEESQIAMGGVDQRRLLEPLSWAPVSMPELGYWQVPILAVRVNGELLDVCKDGTCRGVADTGTSHLGVPAPHDKELARLLTTEAGDTLDCRLIEAPEVEIELPGYTLTLHPHNYMRRLPLREGVSVSSEKGVHVPDPNTTNANKTNGTASPSARAAANASSVGGAVAAEAEEEQVRRFCSPRLMPVRLPEPLGPKLFILGEPVLHRYYSVYDWGNNRVGFGLANNAWNNLDFSSLTDRRGTLPKEVDMLLMQETAVVSKTQGTRRTAAVEEEVAMVQLTVRLSVRTRRV